MRRSVSAPRPDFAQRAAEIGFAFAEIDGETYWDESARYEFSLREIEDDLEAPTEELGALCLEVAAKVVRDEATLRRLAIPEHAWGLIAESWTRGDKSLYGRFDFAYDGESAAKLLEYNADTPTSLFESAVVQWQWLRDLVERKALPADADQFNSLHEKLIARWRAVAPIPDQFLHLACMQSSVEDSGTIAYLADCATQAGLETMQIDMGDIGFLMDRFADREDRHIECLFKLYPWEWMFADEFGKSPAMKMTRFFEPPWKAILSNKGFLALLWDAAPNHPNLLPTYFENDYRADSLGENYARKPLLSREGANVTLYQGAHILARTSGDYGAEGYVRQALRPLPDFDGFRPVIGSWLVGDEAAGVGIREDRNAITSNRSRFVPHVIVD
ncbi:MAG: glutathionylspermidine synthase family protein [Rhodoblastus sp.]